MIPFLRGVSPWILQDFRSPRRNLPDIQDHYNRKGLISERGQRKQAFFVLQAYYERLTTGVPMETSDATRTAAEEVR